MIWLASYPRSGNTFVRIILRHVFGLRTLSLYDEPPHKGLSLDQVARLGTSPRRIVVKTHGRPLDQSPAIYVIRDGRVAIDSYFHFLRDEASNPLPLENIIAGLIPEPNWSAHYRAWDPARRPNTLLLKYEDLKTDHAGQVSRLATFLQIEPKREYLNDFEYLHRLRPAYYRKAAGVSDTPGLVGLAADLFWFMHGSAMVALGYTKTIPAMPNRHEQVLSFVTSMYDDHVESLNADRKAKDEVISRVVAQLQEIEADRRAKKEIVDSLVVQLDATRAERAADAQTINTLLKEARLTKANLKDKERRVKKLEAALAIEARRPLNRLRRWLSQYLPLSNRPSIR
jgi:hypothetical protein